MSQRDLVKIQQIFELLNSLLPATYLKNASCQASRFLLTPTGSSPRRVGLRTASTWLTEIWPFKDHGLLGCWCRQYPTKSCLLQ